VGRLSRAVRCAWTAQESRPTKALLYFGADRLVADFNTEVEPLDPEICRLQQRCWPVGAAVVPRFGMLVTSTLRSIWPLGRIMLLQNSGGLLLLRFF
jgi:hypothetical protein